MLHVRLLPERFIVTTLHLIIAILAGCAYHSNIHARLSFADVKNVTEVSEAAVNHTALELQLELYFTEYQGVLAASYFFFAVEFLSMLSMFSMFSGFPNIVGLSLHFLGAFVTLWYCLDGWSSESFTGIFLLFSFLPAMVEGGFCSFYFFINWPTRDRLKCCSSSAHKGGDEGPGACSRCSRCACCAGDTDEDTYESAALLAAGEDNDDDEGEISSSGEEEEEDDTGSDDNISESGLATKDDASGSDSPGSGRDSGEEVEEGASSQESGADEGTDEESSGDDDEEDGGDDDEDSEGKG